MNVTTLGIFLLGEGNTLLSIRLENGKKYEEATFASEVLACGKPEFSFYPKKLSLKKYCTPIHIFETAFERLYPRTLTIMWMVITFITEKIKLNPACLVSIQFSIDCQVIN